MVCGCEFARLRIHGLLVVLASEKRERWRKRKKRVKLIKMNG